MFAILAILILVHDSAAVCANLALGHIMVFVLGKGRTLMVQEQTKTLFSLIVYIL